MYNNLFKLVIRQHWLYLFKNIKIVSVSYRT